MESANGEECIILNTDDENEVHSESSVLLVEPSEGLPSKEQNKGEAVDEESELIVTFCKRPKLMPHARYDCSSNPFERAESETSHPLGKNAETCGECYCYICNKRAVECKDWVTPSLCHCNAHNKSKYWKDRWNFALVGSLVMFNLDLSETDGDIQRGGTLLQKFTHDISVAYNKYLSGERLPPDCQKCLCHRKLSPGDCDTCNLLPQYFIYSYSSVSDLVMDFLNQAEKEKPKAETIMLLGAAREIALHKCPTDSQNVDLPGTLTKTVVSLMIRITHRLQRLLILNDFPKPLYNKLVHFYKSIPFPMHCLHLVSSLNFITWDNSLLTSVLKGQNVTGQRTQKKKKESLWEIIPVIEARIEKMEKHGQYRELVRYLKVVRCRDYLHLQQHRHKIPFYLCRSGDIQGGALALFSFYHKTCCAACCLSPSQFEMYLKIFRTGQVPSGKELEKSSKWMSVGTPLPLPFLVKQIVKLVCSNSSLYKNPQCWSALIRTFSSYSILGEDGCLLPLIVQQPPPDFQEMIISESCYIVKEATTNSKFRNNIFSPEVFGVDTHLEIGLIFVVQLVRQMILQEHHSLTSFLDVVLAFGKNIWALRLLLESLTYRDNALRTIVGLTITELQSRKAEMLPLWHHFGPWYVCELLNLFLSSRDRNVPSIGIIIINIIKENLAMCLWAKQVGEFLQSSRRHFGWVSPDVSSFIDASQTLW